MKPMLSNRFRMLWDTHGNPSVLLWLHHGNLCVDMAMTWQPVCCYVCTIATICTYVCTYVCHSKNRYHLSGPPSSLVPCPTPYPPPTRPLPAPRSLINLPVDKRFSEDECRDYFIDLILGLEYCEQLTLVPGCCHVTSHFVPGLLSCHVTSHFVPGLLSCHVTSHCVSGLLSCHVTSHFVSGLLSCHVTSHFVPGLLSCHVMSCHTLSLACCHVMLCHTLSLVCCHGMSCSADFCFALCSALSQGHSSRH